MAKIHAKTLTRAQLHEIFKQVAAEFEGQMPLKDIRRQVADIFKNSVRWYERKAHHTEDLAGFLRGTIALFDDPHKDFGPKTVEKEVRESIMRRELAHIQAQPHPALLK